MTASLKAVFTWAVRSVLLLSLRARWFAKASAFISLNSLCLRVLQIYYTENRKKLTLISHCLS